MKTDKTKRTKQREYNGDLTEEQLTKLLQEAYEQEVPTLSEELLQKTLEKAKAAEQEAEQQSRMRPAFLRQLIGNVVVKRCVLVSALCMLLVVCGRIAQENGVFVKKESAPESYDMASAKNETSGGMYFNGAISNDIGMMADSAQSITEEDGTTDEECAERLPQAEMGTTDTSVTEKAQQVEQEAENNLTQNGTGTTNHEKIEQAETENEQSSSKEENFGADSTHEPVEKESIYKNLAGLLPLFPQEVYGGEAIYTLWIDGVQVKSGWETALEDALRYSPPEPLALQEQYSDGLTEAGALSADTFFLETDILFTLVVSFGETTYCMEVGTCTKVTIEQNGEKRSTFFAILDLTLYEEILTMNL